MAKKKSKKKIKQKKQKQPGFLKQWWESQKERKPILKFVLFLALIMAAFFAVSFTEFFENTINLPLVLIYAKVGNAILNLFGLQTEVVQGTQIVSPLFNMNIAKGCDAISPTALFMAAVAVYPTVFANKWKYLLIAPFAFALLNVVRIVSLYLLGAYAPDFFDFAHYEFWQGVFILLTIIAWFYWLLSVLNKKQTL